MFSCLIIAVAEPSCSQNLHFDHSALRDTANSQEDRFNRWLINKCVSELELTSLASMVKNMIRAFLQPASELSSDTDHLLLHLAQKRMTVCSQIHPLTRQPATPFLPFLTLFSLTEIFSLEKGFPAWSE